MLRQFILILLSVFLIDAGLWASFEAQAATLEAGEGLQKINIAGRQRMLSQRMAGSACLSMMGADEALRREVTAAAHADFETALAALVSGAESMGLSAESDPDVLAALEVVEHRWHHVGPAVMQISNRDLHPTAIRQLTLENVPLLQEANAAVTVLAETYSGGDMSPDLARTINFAGRQRMLSQKMIKEACFVQVGLNVAANLAALKASVALFDTTLRHLQRGDAEAGVVAPPRPEIAQQLDVVAELWVPLKAGLGEHTDPNTHNSERLAALAQQADALLKQMHKAVLLYASD